MKYICIVLLAVLLTINAQTFTADFELRTPSMRGVLVGTIKYNWDVGSIRFDYPSKKYFEILDFNDNKGSQLVPSTTPFRSQWVYKVGSTCACETGAMDYAMPILFKGPAVDKLLSDGWDVAPGKNVLGQTCDQYTLKAGKVDLYGGLADTGYLQSFCLKTDGSPVQAIFQDGREYRFSNWKSGGNSAPDFTPPTNCKCGKPIDIVFVLDRSSSISQIEWKDQKTFLQNFADQFEYGPLQANLAIVHFNRIFWTSLTLADGSSKANVDANINSLQCCADANLADPQTFCCCCGTSISGGYISGINEMIKSTRQGITKVILTLTDGYHNTKPDGTGCTGDTTGSDCDKDLIAARDYGYQKVPDIIPYAIGVGADRDFSTAQLQRVAGDDPNRVLTSNSFGDLAKSTIEFVARTCDQNTLPCGGCCGFCVCAECQPPDKCDQPTDLCLTASVQAGAKCCSNAKNDCPLPNTACVTYACDSTTGQCPPTPVPIPADDQCFTWQCDATQNPPIFSTKRPNVCDTVKECTIDADCAAKNPNKCTTATCDTTTDPANPKCKFADIDCTKQAGFAPDMCSSVECDPSSGCKRTPFDTVTLCEDNNNCTIDSCDLQKGCVHENITCADANLCTVDICDPGHGCLFVPLVCAADINQAALIAQKPADQIDPTCISGFCDAGACQTKVLDCPAGATTETIVGASLGTAAIVGIIVAAVLALAAIGGGGAYAYAQAGAAGDVSVVGNNPIYTGAGNTGVNPLYAQ